MKFLGHGFRNDPFVLLMGICIDSMMFWIVGFFGKKLQFCFSEYDKVLDYEFWRMISFSLPFFL